MFVAAKLASILFHLTEILPESRPFRDNVEDAVQSAAYITCLESALQTRILFFSVIIPDFGRYRFKFDHSFSFQCCFSPKVALWIMDIGDFMSMMAVNYWICELLSPALVPACHSLLE
ncbi:hypothetical protein BDQ12DRAFT_680664 [Crucibulum laeve]|uniref:Uncharacterized protein n=1 Tax=Crucibulum laeve TaxID=68775 RepID=A0A5C3M4F4_9AGAR|nr:hypothetical protein BDQ12DRAFT_680664 [Crucibulum laeve]